MNGGVPSILALPTELVTEILAHVASSSIADLFGAKLCCRDMFEATENKQIYSKVSLEKFPILIWRNTQQASSFFDRCKESGNPEALFRRGVVEYFGHNKLESGIENLKTAAKTDILEIYIPWALFYCAATTSTSEKKAWN